MGKIYYYYCSTETFKSMLKSHSLWLTDLTKSNDEEEVTRTFVNLWSKVKEILPDTDLDKDVLESQIEMIDSATQCQIHSDVPYGCCFSAECDLVQQWLEYGGRGDGVAVGFDLEWFGIPKQYPTTSTELMQSIGYEQVIYDLPGREKEFAKIFYASIKQYGLKAWVMAILPTLKHYSGFIKNPSFKDERETRIAYYPCTYAEVHGQIDVLSGLIQEPRPHYCLNWKKNDSSAMRSIMIGNACSLSEAEIEELLKSSNINEKIQITHSECSYRQRL